MAKIRIYRFVTLLSMMFVVAYASAGSKIPNYGGCYYSYGAGELFWSRYSLLTYILYIDSLLYAIASLLAVYSATSIYVKMMYGEGGFTKSVMTLIGAVLFIVSSIALMPSFFGYRVTKHSVTVVSNN